MYKVKEYIIRKYETRDFTKICNFICKFQKKAKLIGISDTENMLSARNKRIQTENFLKEYEASRFHKYVAVNTETNDIFLYCVFVKVGDSHQLKFTVKNPDCLLQKIIVRAFKEIINQFCTVNQVKELYSPLTKRENYDKYTNYMLKTFDTEQVESNETYIKIKYNIPLDI